MTAKLIGTLSLSYGTKIFVQIKCDLCDEIEEYWGLTIKTGDPEEFAKWAVQDFQDTHICISPYMEEE